MMKNRLAASSLLVALAGLAACSPDAPVGPVAQVRAPVVTNPSFVLLAQPSAGLPSTMTVCSDDASATFSVSVFSNALGAPQVPPLVGAGPYTLAVAANACATIWIKAAFTSVPTDPTTTVTVTQTGVQAGWQFSLVEASGNTGTSVNQATRTATLAANGFHGATATFTQTLIPVCTFTKGWYQNKNGAPTIVLTLDGRTPAQQRAIFEASPGQPGGVTWGVGALTDNKPNNLLNLYQQFLAALNNLNGNATGGPTSVDNAIAAVIAGTAGSNLHISTTMSAAQISAAIDALSAFNEGTLTGFPHCPD